VVCRHAGNGPAHDLDLRRSGMRHVLHGHATPVVRRRYALARASTEPG
jgi:hypothetical protein